MNKKNMRIDVSTPHPVLRLLTLGLLSFLFTLFSLKLTVSGSSLSPLWFPTAIMMAAFYRHPASFWPGIAAVSAAGILLASLMLFPANHIVIMFPIINIVEALFGAILLRKLLPSANPLQNLNNWVKVVLGSAIIPPIFGATLAVIFKPTDDSINTFSVWLLSESIAAVAIVPIGLLLKPRALSRLRNPRLFIETAVALSVTLLMSWLALHYLPWPFTFIIVLLMWSAIRLPRLEAFTIFLATVMVVSLILTRNPALLAPPHPTVVFDAPWLPFLMILLPANVMTMVMYAFREESKHISESETRFRNAMEYSSIGMALVSIDGYWLQVNKSLCQFLGYTPEKMSSMTFQQITWPEDLHDDLEQLESLIKGDINSYSLEKRYFTQAGEVVWALVSVSVVRDGNGAPLYFIAQVEDINDLKHTEWMNKRLMERMTLANEAGGIGIWEWEIGPDIISWDKRMFELYDIAPHIKPTYQLWASRVVKEDLGPVEMAIHDALKTRIPFKIEFRIQVKEGIRHIRALANRVINKHGDVERLLGVNMDMTEVKQLNEALFQEKERLHITLDSIGEAVICTDVEMNVTFMNPVAEKMSGWSQEQAIGQPLLSVLRITFGDKGPLMDNIHSGDVSRTTIEQDVVLHCRNGGSYDIHYTVTPLSTLDGQNIGSVLVIQDVTESRKMLRQLSYSASHDALTHLANRVSFENHLKRLLQSVGENHQRHALVCIDLDRFKAVNDTAGHAAGDALLRELASLMLGMLRTTDILARLGGDEFGLLLPDCGLENAYTISSRLIQAVNNYHFMWEGRLHRVGASAGITLIDANNNAASEVMSQADIACYASKNKGRGVVTVYEPQQQHLQQQRASLPHEEQHRIIHDNHLMLLARAIASPRIPESTNFWLLSLRLWTSEGNALDEYAFRSNVSDPALLCDLDLRVFHEFLKKHASPIALKGFGVALPLSPQGLANDDVVNRILATLCNSTLPPRLLHFTIHSDVLLADDERATKNLIALRNAGCRVIISQVGRDMEIFNRINRQMCDYIMIEPELVRDVHTNLMDEMMVTIIQGHVQRLGLKCIAGPADETVVMDTLSGIGIDMIWGDTIAQAQPLDMLLNQGYFAIN